MDETVHEILAPRTDESPQISASCGTSAQISGDTCNSNASVKGFDTDLAFCFSLTCQHGGVTVGEALLP